MKIQTGLDKSIIDIYITFFTCNQMKLKDFLTKVSKNSKNNQLTACFKRRELKKKGISVNKLLDLDIDFEHE